MTLRRLLIVTLLVTAAGLAVSGAGPRTVLARGAVRVLAADGDRTWTIGNDLITILIGLDRNASFGIRAIDLPGAGRRIELDGSSDHFLTMGGVVSGFGVTEEGWRYVETVTEEHGTELRLGFLYEHDRQNVRAARWYAASPHTPTIETWTSIAATDSVVTLAGLNLLHLSLPPGDVDWLTGLHAPGGNAGPFTRQRTHLEPGDALVLGAAGRSSEYAVPWLAIDQGPDKLYVGLLWSGAWGVEVRRLEASVRVSAGLPANVTELAPGQSLDTPHLYLGVARGPEADVAAALRPFLRETLRHGRGWDPLVTANTWYAFGTQVTAAAVVDELAAHARLGAELFVLDAGWYAGRGERWDFTSGLGSWEVDDERFPDGLGPLGDEARHRGLRFGVWVEPERVDLDTVGRAGLAQERWLATHDGVHDPDRAPDETHAAQICLAGDEARQWVWNQLVRFIEGARPDYLKWDNNLWVNCNRPGHGHGAGDGNLRHVQALYGLLSALRERYPHLVIENVSGGGNRMDLGMARVTDVGWMDDRSAPAAYVRHNLEGLSALFPPAYLLSFVLDAEDEPLVDAPDLGLYLRSRMPGVLGFSFRAGVLDDETLARLAAEVEVYKHVRDILRNGTAALLTAQSGTGGDGGWDVLHATSADQPESAVFAFQQRDGAGETVIRPRGLQPGVTYRVRAVDAGDIGTASGHDLMTFGLGLHEGRSAAHIIILEPAVAGVRGKRD